MAVFSAETCGQSVDIGGAGSIDTGATLAAGYGPMLGLHCSVSGTYRIYGVDTTSYKPLYLPAGGPYPYVSTKITDVSGNAIADNVICVFPR